MKGRLVTSLCLATLLLPLRIAVAEPPKGKPTTGPLPPKVAATPTPMRMVSRQVLTLAPCSVVATLAVDSAFIATHNLVMKYVGPMTFTANRDLFAVSLYTMNYDEGRGGDFIGGCNCPQFPKGGDNPAAAPANTNFKRLESRTYQISCAWPTGGLPQTGPFRFEVYIAHFIKNSAGAWQKKIDSCGNLRPAG